jgi:hypothetical protein
MTHLIPFVFHSREQFSKKRIREKKKKIFLVAREKQR